MKIITKTVVCFTNEEYAKIEEIVKQREINFTKRTDISWGRINADQSGTERITGLACEWAVKHYIGKGAEIDEGDYSESRPTNIDLKYLDKKLSIRSTVKLENNLLVRPKEEIGVDGFVFCITRPRYVWLYGWVDKERFFKECYEFDPNNLGKPIYIMKKERLSPISELAKWLNFNKSKEVI